MTQSEGGITDPELAALVAAGTGFRANALANLTPADLGAGTPTLTLAARLNKSRKLKVQPLPADVADALRPYLAGKPAGSPVWGGTWSSSSDGAEMIRRDLETVGIPYAVKAGRAGVRGLPRASWGRLPS